jgi:single-stranded-DNA-specific exonuclease
MRWKITSKKELSVNSKLSLTEQVVNILLENRGLTTHAAQQSFLSPPKPEDLNSRDLGIRDSQIIKAITIIKEAIKNKEAIVVYGDYDPDGICATAIMWETLDSFGAKVMPFIPTRDEGYGLKVERLDQLAKEGVRLVITVDQGIVHHAQAEHARKIGLKLIITDHHLQGEKLPKAEAIVHTTKLAGCGIAWYLANRLAQKIKPVKNRPDPLDLAVIGSITDMIPLLGPNRSLVKHGLPAVAKTKRLGLQALYREIGLAKTNFTTYDIAFLIGPRLNAMGRLADPSDSLRLVCTRNRTRAEELAASINRQNQERQTLMEKMTISARKDWLAKDGKSPLIFVYSETFHLGVIGLIASKLTEEFYRPTVVVAVGAEESKGSARSITGFNIVEAVRSCSDLLLGHGGHPYAAGFSVKTAKIEILKDRLIKLAKNTLKPESMTPVQKVDLKINLKDLDLNLLNHIAKLEPFGEGNREPVFASCAVNVADTRLIGRDKNHLSLKIKNDSGDILKAVGFNMGDLFLKLSPDKKVDIAYNISLDEWDGERKLQLKIKDIRL